MRARVLGAVVWLAFLTAISAGLAGLTLGLAPEILASSVNTAPIELQVLGLLLAALALPGVGAVVASRRPKHPVGWLLLASGLSFNLGLLLRPLLIGLGNTADLAEAVGRVPFWSGVALALLAWLVFPTGKTPTPRWRFVVWVVVAFAALDVVAAALDFAVATDASFRSNPIYAAEGPVEAAFFVLLVGAPLLVALAFARRLRSASHLERQQIKWLVFPSLLMAGVLLVSFPLQIVLTLVLPPDIATNIIDTINAIFFLLFGLLPVGAGIAILRYRLLDVDLLINRTLVYGALTAFLAGLYSASVALSQALLRERLGAPSIEVVVLSTLIAAASFTPVRNSLQRVVDRVIAAEREPAKELGAFAEQVQMLGRFVNVNQLNSEGLLGELLDRSTEAFGATGGALFLGAPDRERVARTHGQWTGDACLNVPLEDAGKTYGRLALGPRANRQPYQTKDRDILSRAVESVAPLAKPRSEAPTAKPRKASRSKSSAA